MSAESPTTKRPRTDQERPSPTIILLCGLPGAGKSTFASSLIAQNSAQRWVRINQDTVAGGRRGTKQQVIAATRTTLSRGCNVIIDRTNLNPDQRREFVSLGKEFGSKRRIYCVFFDLDAKTCASRAAGRVNHEGGLHGGGAYPTVAKLAKTLIAPDTEKEEFAGIMRCRNDKDAEAALGLWAGYDPSSTSLFDLEAEWRSIRPTGNIETSRKSTKDGHQRSIDTFFSKPPHEGDFASAGGMIKSAEPGSVKNAFDIMKAAAARQGTQIEPQASHNKAAGAGASRHTFANSPFLSALLSYLHDPEKHRAQLNPSCRADERCVLVPDKYPKARHHALVIARDPRLQGPLDLTIGTHDADLVRHMADVGRRWAMEQDPHAQFVMGFHSVPSMKQLHLHVISSDYESPCLKTKKHWLSFTSPFFLDVGWVLKQLDGPQGEATDSCTTKYLDYDTGVKEGLLKGPLRCHICHLHLPNMPQLKDHIRGCASALREKNDKN